VFSSLARHFRCPNHRVRFTRFPVRTLHLTGNLIYLNVSTFREFPKRGSTSFLESVKRLERLELSVAVERLERIDPTMNGAEAVERLEPDALLSGRIIVRAKVLRQETF
jgi:hypothetical protein